MMGDVIDVDLPEGVELLTEPIGWRCRACGGRVTMPDADTLRRPELVAAALEHSAKSHLRACEQ